MIPVHNSDENLKSDENLGSIVLPCNGVLAFSQSKIKSLLALTLTSPFNKVTHLLTLTLTRACCVTGTPNSIYTAQCDGVGVAPHSVSHSNLHWSCPSYLLHKTSGGGGEGVFDKYPPTVFTIDPNDTVSLHTDIYTPAPTPTIPSTTLPTCPRL